MVASTTNIQVAGGHHILTHQLLRHDEQKKQPPGFERFSIVGTTNQVAPSVTVNPGGKSAQETQIPDNSCTYVMKRYNDYSCLYDSFHQEETRKVRSGTSRLFPERLHAMLEIAEELGFADIISWQPHGRAFLVRDPKRFLREILPKYFKVSKFESFQRQLNLYSFTRIRRKGPDHGCYYHERFLRGMPALCIRIERGPTGGSGDGKQSFCSIDNEPDFYRMTYLPPHSEAEPGPASQGLGVVQLQQKNAGIRSHVNQHQGPRVPSPVVTKRDIAASPVRNRASNYLLGQALWLAGAAPRKLEESLANIAPAQCHFTDNCNDSFLEPVQKGRDDNSMEAAIMSIPVAADVLRAIDYRIFDD